MEKAVFTPKVLIFRKNGNFFRQNEFYNIACKTLAICIFMWYIEQNQCEEAIFSHRIIKQVYIYLEVL